MGRVYSEDERTRIPDIMREIDRPGPGFVPCLLTFMGCGNAKWLLFLPLNPKIPEVEIVINHPWTGEAVALRYRGNHSKRQNVTVFVQEKEKPVNHYSGGGHGLFT